MVLLESQRLVKSKGTSNTTNCYQKTSYTGNHLLICLWVSVSFFHSHYCNLFVSVCILIILSGLGCWGKTWRAWMGTLPSSPGSPKGRPQFVCCVSDRLISNIRGPQGTVLSPFLFTTYTADFKYCSESSHLQKYSDDLAVVGCAETGREEEYRRLVEDLAVWGEPSAAERWQDKNYYWCMVIDFGHKKSTPLSISISGTDVELITSYKYFGVNLDCKLEWSTNTEVLYKKGLSWLYFLRKLRSFNICNRMLYMFYQSVAGIRVKGSNRLNKLIKKGWISCGY